MSFCSFSELHGMVGLELLNIRSVGCLFLVILDLQAKNLTGLRYAGSRDGNLQELLYKYALYFLNEVCSSPCCADYVYNAVTIYFYPADKTCICLKCGISKRTV